MLNSEREKTSKDALTAYFKARQTERGGGRSCVIRMKHTFHVQRIISLPSEALSVIRGN